MRVGRRKVVRKEGIFKGVLRKKGEERTQVKRYFKGSWGKGLGKGVLRRN